MPKWVIRLGEKYIFLCCQTNALLCAIRNYFNEHILKTIYFAKFDPHIDCINYSINYFLLIIFGDHWGRGYKKLSFFVDIINGWPLTEKELFINKLFILYHQSLINGWFTFWSYIHNYQTWWADSVATAEFKDKSLVPIELNNLI